MTALIFVVTCILQLVKCIYSARNVEYADPQYLDSLLETKNFKEFCRLLQIKDVGLVRPLEGNETINPHLQSLDFGDVLLRPIQKEKATQVGNLTRYPVSIWKRKQVPYYISKTGYNSTDYQKIVKAIQDWNEKIPQVQYRPKRRGDRHYVMIFNGNGCYANLGRVGGQQAISYQNGSYCWFEGYMHHELIHTVGLNHEHLRPDRDNYVEVLYNNIEKDWQRFYQNVDFDLYGPYDYYSVMHYPVPAVPGLDPEKPAFRILRRNVDNSKIGVWEKMTDIDMMKVANLYSG